MHIRRTIISNILAFSLIFTTALAAAGQNKDREVTVMTRNMYLGTDFSEIFQAGSFPELLSEVAEAYTDVENGNVNARISVIADEIEAAGPALVGLQEAALWRTGPFLDAAPATTETFDFLRMLLDELKDRGLHYAVISVQENLDAELPAVFSDRPPSDVRFTDRVAILARTDLPISEFKLGKTDSRNFATALPFPHPVVGTILITRGWNSADVKMRGKKYRFVNAHLESFFEPVQLGQAFELLSGPAKTTLPLILAGDFNSDAETNGNGYQILLSGGLTDVWPALNPGDPGLTWPTFLLDPFTPTGRTQRLDLIFTRGGITPKTADLVGAGPVLLPAPIPSDHAGVVAKVVLEP